MFLFVSHFRKSSRNNSFQTYAYIIIIHTRHTRTQTQCCSRKVLYVDLWNPYKCHYLLFMCLYPLKTHGWIQLLWIYRVKKGFFSGSQGLKSVYGGLFYRNYTKMTIKTFLTRITLKQEKKINMTRLFLREVTNNNVDIYNGDNCSMAIHFSSFKNQLSEVSINHRLFFSYLIDIRHLHTMEYFRSIRFMQINYVDFHLLKSDTMWLDKQSRQ